MEYTVQYIGFTVLARRQLEIYINLNFDIKKFSVTLELQIGEIL